MAPARPNILLITSDQQHAGTLGCVNDRIQTPALDRLASEGVRFDRAYCPNPTCTPTRASIITGLYPSQHGAWSLGTKLFESVPTIGQLLSHAGYATSLVGKAHFQPLATKPGMESIECQPTLRDLEFWRNFHGPWYGFDHVETARMHGDESHAGQHYALWLKEKGLDNWEDYFRVWPQDPEMRDQEQYYDREKRSWTLPEELHYTTWTAERTLAQIEQAAATDRPFFCWSSFHDPHPPYIVPEPWASMYDPADMQPGQLQDEEHALNPPHFGLTQQDRPDFSTVFRDDNWLHGSGTHRRDPEELKKDMACYYGMVSFMDQQIGRILDRLDALGQAENTLVVFSTDHGHFLGQHGLTAKAIHHYEDLLRIPYLVRWPGGGVPAGQTSDALQNLVDLAPSFAAAAGLDIPHAMTGVNQLPCWQAGPAVRNVSITENHHGRNYCHMRTLVTDRYKITVYARHGFGELFDLREDPGEVRNLWDDPASQELKKDLLQQFLQATMQSESLPMPRIAGA